MFATYPPRQCRADAVREFYVFRRPVEPVFHKGLPKPFVEIVFDLGGAFEWRAAADGQSHRFAEGWLNPVQHGPRYARGEAGHDLIAARLHPVAAYEMFGALPPGDGRPPPHLADLGLAWLDALRRTLIGETSDEGRVAAFDHALAVAPRVTRWPFPPLPSDAKTVEELATALESSPRATHRQFVALLGFTPKTWLRLMRLQRVIDDGQARLAAVAAEHGLYDQAHLAREFRHFADMTPGAYRRQRRAPGSPPHFVAARPNFPSHDGPRG